MRKLCLIILTVFMLLLKINNVNAISTTSANEEIDVDKKVNLTINYHYNELLINNVKVKIYHIASISNDFQYKLNSPFNDYAISFDGINNKDKWDMVKNTLNAYIEADGIKENFTSMIVNNSLELNNLPVGLYLIKTESIDEEAYTLNFDSFLISLPALLENGKWNYEVELYPKGYEYIPKYEKINYRVIKEWEDDGESRPNEINISIYKNNELIEEKTLSSANNWTYEWIGLDDGSIWNVIEKEVPNGYKVSIMKNENNFIVINHDINYEEDNPQTSDNINFYLWIFIISLISLIIMILYLIKGKRS